MNTLLTLDMISFAPGTCWCLHPANQEQHQSLLHGLASRLCEEGIHAMVATPANPKTMKQRLFRQPTVVQWLVENSELRPAQAAAAIEEFPIPVAPLLCQNARNPLQFLGMAAAIAKQPAVIVYETSGMDPMGVKHIHRYAPEHFANGCLIHVSCQPLGYVPPCPNKSTCLHLSTAEAG